jgi:hypothetical protein
MRINPRFRRNLSFSAAVFGALLLAIAGAVHYRFFHATLEQNARGALEKDWGAMKGYLRLERESPSSEVRANWYYDDRDAEESVAVKGIRDRCVIVDRAGRIVHQPPSLPAMGNRLAGILKSLDSRDTTIITEIRDDHATYLVRAGVLSDERRSSGYPAALVLRLHGAPTGFGVSLLGAVVGALMVGLFLPKVRLDLR